MPLFRQSKILHNHTTAKTRYPQSKETIMFSYHKETDSAILVLEDGQRIATVIGEDDTSPTDLMADASDLIHHLNHPCQKGPEFNCISTTLHDKHGNAYFNTINRDEDSGTEATEIVAPNGSHIAYVSDYQDACTLCSRLNRELI
jgi:hypothetical protein